MENKINNIIRLIFFFILIICIFKLLDMLSLNKIEELINPNPNRNPNPNPHINAYTNMYPKQNQNLSPEQITSFLSFQKYYNPDILFNLQQLQKQITPDELKFYYKNGYWKWSDNTKKEYIKVLWSSPILKIDPNSALNNAMKIYNEKAAKMLISWNNKEGIFLLNGLLLKSKQPTMSTNQNPSPNQNLVDLGGTNGKEVLNLEKQLKLGPINNIKCGPKGKLIKTNYVGYNLWNGYRNEEIEIIENKDIEKEVPGFKFLKEQCNPCVALDGDYSCPFSINIDGDNSLSPMWKELWGL